MDIHEGQFGALTETGVETIAELLVERAKSDAMWIRVPRDPLSGPECDSHTFADVLRVSRRFASVLTARFPIGSRILTIFENGPEFLHAFFGSMLAGMVPVPISPPLLVRRPKDYLERVERIVAEADVAHVVVEDRFAGALPDHMPASAWSVLLGAPSAASRDWESKSSAVAFIQYSSGSTREPLGVELTHAAILNNVGAVAKKLSTKRSLCWIPLFHDMGLAGLVLQSLNWGAELVLMKPVDFISNPARWLWAMSHFQADLCAAPNFAYALCADRVRIPDDKLEGLDLRHWQFALNGSEPVQADTVEAFGRRFARHGFDRRALWPVYGLAENVLACSFASSLHVDAVDRGALETHGVAVPPDPTARTRSFVSVGTALDGQAVRIVDAQGKVLPERSVGEVQILSTSAMLGYVGKPHQTAAAFSKDRWLRTGDLGYIAESELYIVGRSKNIIKRAGRAFDAADLGELVSAVEGVRPGCVAAFGLPNPSRGTEDVVVVVETTLVGPEAHAKLKQDIVRCLSTTLATTPDEIVLVQKGSLPKSSSGKIRNSECMRLHLSRELETLQP